MWSFSFLLLAGFAACQRPVQPAEGANLFDSLPVSVTVRPAIEETSGIADTYKNPGFLWAHEDSGHPPELILLQRDGTVRKRIAIRGASNRDWEDMALVNNTIYIGDIGDNNSAHSESVIYKFPEPDATLDTVPAVEAIRFRYQDGPMDAEAFLVDPATECIYLISKRQFPGLVYKLTPPFDAGVNVAFPVARLTIGGVVGAALSADQSEVILKTYTSLHYYKRKGGESLESLLQRTPVLLAYIPEPQGEAVAFSRTGDGFFTLSERASAASVSLNFYQRR